MRPFLREPLLHFVLLGAGLFALHHFVAAPEGGEGEAIVITEGKIAQLAAGFERMHQRPPDRAELDELVADAVREEIYYREAKALGLDEDDGMVRRRLRQKLEFLSEDTAPVPEPSDDELQAYLQEHAEAFVVAARVGFRHVYLEPQQHGGEAGMRAEAERLRQALADGVDAEALGDPFLLARRFDGVTQRELALQFGEEFAAALQSLPVGVWQGPIASGFGAHLVLVEHRDAGQTAELEDVRAAVRREWMHDWRQRENARFYDSLRARYTVTIEGSPAAAGPAAALAGASP